MQHSTSICVLLIVVGLVGSLPDEPDKTFDQLYLWARQAYTNQRWYECVAFIKRALVDYQYWQDNLVYCRKQCEIEVPLSKLKKVVVDSKKGELEENENRLEEEYLWERRMLTRQTQRALCLTRCKQERFGLWRKEPNDEGRSIDDFERKEPYSYLQYCYWQLQDIENAAASAYTCLMGSPSNEMMRENVEYFMRQPDFRRSYLKDFEQRPYQIKFLEGSQGYDDHDFELVADRMEESFRMFLEEEDRCRYLCQGPYDVINWPAVDAYSTVAGAYWSMAACRFNCTAKLSWVRGKFVPDFVPLHFHYLQFAYWKIGVKRKAFEAAGTYLMFYPKDENMLYNKKLYIDQHGAKEEHFAPRPEAVEYFKRQARELEVVKYFTLNFNYQDGHLPEEQVGDYEVFAEEFDDLESIAAQLDLAMSQIKNQSELQQQEQLALKVGDGGLKKSGEEGEQQFEMPFIAEYRRSSEELERIESEQRVHFVQSEQQLNGSHRFVVEQMLSGDECVQLVKLTTQFGELGSGYEGKGPLSSFEDFTGVTISRAANLAEKGEIKFEQELRLYFEKSEALRRLVESYFKLSSPLYIDYTHLVCRTARPMPPGGRDGDDLSHPIHADNCLLRDDGQCDKQPPAFTWRDYSAVLYLNDDFDGGEFVFTDNHRKSQAEVKPRCGVGVGFIGSTFHGVKAVRRGARCALALWMTLDPQHQELDRIKVAEILKKHGVVVADSSSVGGQQQVSSDVGGGASKGWFSGWFNNNKHQHGGAAGDDEHEL